MGERTNNAAMEDGACRAGGRAQRTALAAVCAGLPGLAVTALAAIGSNALTLRIDLLLSLLDMAVLVVALLIVRRMPGTGAAGGRQRTEALVNGLVGLCMLCSMAAVATAAILRLQAGGAPATGPGVLLGLGQNLLYAGINGAVLAGWRRRHAEAPSAFARAQANLFADKLTSNLLVAGALSLSLACGDHAVARFADPVAGLLMAIASAAWAVPVLRGALRDLRGRAPMAAAASSRY